MSNTRIQHSKHLPDSEFWQPRILRIKLESRDLVPWVLVRIPLNSNVIDWLFCQVLEQLHLEGVCDFVVLVESSGMLGENVDWSVVTNVFVFELLLLLAFWEEGVLDDVVAIAVGGLGPFGHCDHWVRVSEVLFGFVRGDLLCCFGMAAGAHATSASGRSLR